MCPLIVGALAPSVIDVNAAVENMMVMFSTIKELRKDTEVGWKKLATPLEQVIEANNASNVGLKKRDVQLARREDIMDGRVSANRVKVDELCAQVMLAILDTFSQVSTSVSQINNLEVELTILRAQVESNKRGLCRCRQRATSKLSYAEEMDQRQDASSPLPPPSSPPTDWSYRTPLVEEVTQLVLVPKEVQLPSPTSSKEVAVPVPPPHATSPGRVVSGQHCWTCCKVDSFQGSGASSRFFWRSSGL